jgi:hypothetical protein
LIYDSLRENDPDWAPYLGTKISFKFAKQNPRIQAADLFAREAMKAMDNVIGPVKREIRKSWQALRETDRFEVDAFSTEWFEDMKQKLPEQERKMGMNRDMYIEWLHQRKRQHNISNMFHFADWTAKRDKTSE